MNLTFNYSKKPFEMYVSFDPAIDQEKSNIAEYMKTRDVSHLQFKPGMMPTKFYVKNIPRIVFNSMVIKADAASQLILAFQYGIERIDNLQKIFCTEEVEIVNNGLTTWEPTELFTVGEHRIKYISDIDVQQAFNYRTIMEVGSVILKKTDSVPTIKLDYPILPTSIEIIEKMKS